MNIRKVLILGVFCFVAAVSASAKSPRVQPTGVKAMALYGNVKSVAFYDLSNPDSLPETPQMVLEFNKEGGLLRQEMQVSSTQTVNTFVRKGLLLIESSFYYNGELLYRTVCENKGSVPIGSKTFYAEGDLMSTTTVELSEGRSKSTTYDSEGNLTHELVSEWNGLGWPVKQETVMFDMEGEITRSLRNFTYNEQGKILSESMHNTFDGDAYGYTIFYEYDENGNLSGGRLEETPNGEVSALTFKYDACGNWTEMNALDADGNITKTVAKKILYY